MYRRVAKGSQWWNEIWDFPSSSLSSSYFFPLRKTCISSSCIWYHDCHCTWNFYCIYQHAISSMLNWLSWFNLRNRFIYSKSSIDVNFSHPPYICSMKFAIADSLTLYNIVMVASVAKTVTFKQYMKQQICRWLFKFFAHEYYIQF